MRKRYFVQLIDNTIPIYILILNISGHNHTKSLLRTVPAIIFVLKQSNSLIAPNRIMWIAIVLQVTVFHISLLPVLHHVFRVGKITSYCETEIRRKLPVIADISISSGAFHPSYIGKRVRYYPDVARHLYPLLENTVTLVLKKVDHKIDLIIKEPSLYTYIRFYRAFPSEVIRPDPGLRNRFNASYPPSASSTLVNFRQVGKPDSVGDSVITDRSIRPPDLEIIKPRHFFLD